MTTTDPPGAGDRPGAGKLVVLVGLGNPGPRYAGHRHNVGFRVLEELSSRAGGTFKAHKAGADVLETRIGGCRAVLAKPRSFMNTSGGAVAGVARFFKVDPDGIVVVHDELDLDFTRVRLKLGGGENGHNGLRSITKSLGTKDYYRVRVGVGRPPGRMDAADYVLREFGPGERTELDLTVRRCADAAEELLDNGLAAAQNSFH